MKYDAIFTGQGAPLTNGNSTMLMEEQAFVSNGNPFNPFNNVEKPKPSLTKVDSFVSYTEPGPVTSPDVVSTDNFSMMMNGNNSPSSSSGTTNDFMAILERNSAVLQQASEKNEEMNGKKNEESQEQIETNVDNVDAGKDEQNEEPEKNEVTANDDDQTEDKDKSKFDTNYTF